jgi:hypothetical protein
MEVNEQINELLADMIPAAPVVEEAPVVETPIVEEPAVVQASEPEASGEPPLPPADASPAAELATPAQEPPFIPPIEEPVVVVDEKEETIKSLRQQLEEMAAKTLGMPAEVKPTDIKVDDAAALAPPAQPAPVSKGGFISFVESEEQFDEVMKTPEGFNRLLTGVVQRSVETVLRNVPQMVVKLADQQITTRSAINEFYMENKDLVANKAYVGMVANEMASKNPDWALDKLLGELGKEVKTRLKMVAAAQPAAPGAPKPGFVPRGGGGKPPSGPVLTGQDKQISDLIS